MLHVCEREEFIGHWKESTVIHLINRNKIYCHSLQRISSSQRHTKFHPAFHWQICRQLLMQKLLKIISKDSDPLNWRSYLLHQVYNAQVVSRWALNADGRFRFRASPCGICCGQSGVRSEFLLGVIRFSSVSFFPLMLHTYTSFIYHRHHVTLAPDNVVHKCFSLSRLLLRKLKLLHREIGFL